MVLALIATVTGCGTERGPSDAGRQDRDLGAAFKDPDAPRHGKYLFDAANCVGCHTDAKNGGARLAGGKTIDTPLGTYFSRNIAPDPTYGIGNWSDRDFLRAASGISPSGAHDVPFLFDVRATMILWRLLYFSERPLEPDTARSAEWNRGAYLVNAVAHCGECHTPRNLLRALDNARRFTGGRLAGPSAKRVPNITPHPIDGIGTWSLDGVTTVLKMGMTPDGDFVGAPMSEVVKGTTRLTDSDRRSIAIYLKSLPAQPDKGG